MNARVRQALPFALPLGVVLGLHALADATFAVSLSWPWTVVILGIGIAMAFAAARTNGVPFSAPWVVVFCVAVLGVRFIDWDTRKPFLRDLHSLRPGMSSDDVERVMSRWMEGTGWPAHPAGGTTLVDVGTSRTHAIESTTEGAAPTELRLESSRVFRHTNEGWGNSDWGIVRFDADGRVVDVSFSPD